MTDQLYMKMNDGYKIPVVGLGTWKSEPGEATYKAVLDSINAGYRHIDTARAYDNEADVGRAVQDADINRKELFITTKLWNRHQGYDEAIEACEKSLARLGCDYIDLYLIHWPLKDKRNEIKLKKPKYFLEVGVFHGVTARNVCELLSQIHLNDFKYIG